MKITTDTNVLVRAITGDNAQQSSVARDVLESANLVALPVPTLCELVWVLNQGYKTSASDIAEIIRRLMNAGNVVMNRPAVETGLAQLEAGGDFADGAIAHEGAWLGAERFVSFDKQAVKLLERRGVSASLLS